MEHFKHVITMVFFALFTLHVGNMISNIINPSFPEIKKYKRNLQEKQFLYQPMENSNLEIDVLKFLAKVLTVTK